MQKFWPQSVPCELPTTTGSAGDNHSVSCSRFENWPKICGFGLVTRVVHHAKHLLLRIGFGRQRVKVGKKVEWRGAKLQIWFEWLWSALCQILGPEVVHFWICTYIWLGLKGARGREGERYRVGEQKGWVLGGVRHILSAYRMHRHDINIGIRMGWH